MTKLPNESYLYFYLTRKFYKSLQSTCGLLSTPTVLLHYWGSSYKLIFRKVCIFHQVKKQPLVFDLNGCKNGMLISSAQALWRWFKSTTPQWLRHSYFRGITCFVCLHLFRAISTLVNRMFQSACLLHIYESEHCCSRNFIVGLNYSLH